jgi:hypothetical protein
MAYSPIEDKYLSVLTSQQFPDMPAEPVATEPSVDGVQLAEVGATKMGDYGYSGQRQPTMTDYDPTVRERMADFLQAGFEKFGMDRYKARQNAQTLMGGGSSNLPLNMGLADIVPFLGTALQTQEAARMGGEAVTSAQQGNIGTAAMQAGGAAVGMIPGVAGTVKAGKALAPKAGEMIIKATEKTGVPVRGLNIVEQAPQLAMERVPGVQPGEELIVQHNLTASNLLKADKLGGLPVPSLAISKAASPLEGFGEITLIAPKEMAAPSAKNPVFRTDAYSPRFPQIDYQIDAKSNKNFSKLFADTAEKMPDGGYQIDLVLNEWKDREYSRLFKAKFLDEQGLLPNKEDFKTEPWKFYSEVAGKVNDMKPEYQDWLARFDQSLPENGVNVKERIFKGFTYSGDRRYAAVTLDSLVKEMKGGAGGENFNYGVGNMRAVATPKFRTFNQIKVARENVVDSATMEPIKKQTDDAYFNLLERLTKVDKQYRAEDALLEIAQTKRMSSLDRIYGADKVPQDLKADISVFLNKVQELPTEYFEIKPQRAVSLDEFRGAIIPKDTPQAARDVLTKAGITDIHEYSTPEERKGLFQKFGKEMFAAMPAVPMGAATMQDKENK